jgi:PPIC-type PPIASE domain/SurA-like N-terminal domain
MRTQIVVSAVALVILANGALAQGSKQPSKPAAVVNGIAISMAEVEQALKQAGPTATPLTELQRKQMRQEALSLLIDDILLQEFLRRHAPEVDPNEVNKHLHELEDGLKKQGKTLVSFCKETGQTEVQLRINLLNMLQWSAYVNQRLSEQELKDYYEKNKDFFDRVSVRVSHIVLRVGPRADSPERKAARDKLQALRKDLAEGKIDFADAAKKFSQDSSAASGGDIGYIPRKLAVDEEFAREAFSLNAGEVSKVVDTDYGVHLIKCTDRKPGQPSDFTKIKDEVKEFYIEEIRQGIIAGERKSATIETSLP